MKTIVLIDDVQLNLTLLWHLVKRIDGYNSVSFLDPQEALAWCIENEYELVIVDYMMPEMNGIEFIKELKGCPAKKDAPVLMVTANDQIDVRYTALEAGATDFLNKPIDKTEFMIRVRNMLALRSHERKLADKAQWLADEVEKATKEIREREDELIHRLSKAAEYRDPETGSHIKRMSWYSKHIAAQLGFSSVEQALILEAAPMHDIGKVGIPDAILLKPGRLDSAEFELMKEHAKIGYEILSGSASQLMQMAADIALTHHEKYDGSGYPNGLKGEDISIYGRIIAVADVFDALTSSRPYKKAWPTEDAMNYLKENSGKHFDPLCIDAFFKKWDEVLEIRDRFNEG
ncbi:MAG: response regulator [Methylococcaceae bacterium]|nr:response regulator [Methylococcaceae bacterium]